MDTCRDFSSDRTLYSLYLNIEIKNSDTIESMEVLRELVVTLDDGEHTISFGKPTTEKEYQMMYELRHAEYARRGYITKKDGAEPLEHDSFDDLPETQHFIALYDQEKVIGTVRVISQEKLPTEKYFDGLEVPEYVVNLKPTEKLELGRLIVVPPDRDAGIFLPRNVVMLFMFSTLTHYGLDRGYKGGLSFVKNSLLKKLERVQFPIEALSFTQQNYPHDGVLFPYFNQPEDPVTPIAFSLEAVAAFCDKLITNRFVFKQESPERYSLQSNLYTRFLKSVKVL